jgi:NADH dehydrogenase (ubiquinone) Fe-S protein 4
MLKTFLKTKLSSVRFNSTASKAPLAIRKQGELYEADILSGVPKEVSQRLVRIYKPAKSAMQSGVGNNNEWKLDFDVKQKWENELMGWSSSADTVQALRIKFHSKEDAILFAQKQGYEYVVDEPKEMKFKVKSYAKNFKVLIN